jgi:hypothetical protein
MKIKKIIEVEAEVVICDSWCGSCNHYDEEECTCRLFGNENLSVAYDFTCREYVPLRCHECIEKFDMGE